MSLLKFKNKTELFDFFGSNYLAVLNYWETKLIKKLKNELSDDKIKAIFRMVKLKSFKELSDYTETCPEIITPAVTGIRAINLLKFYINDADNRQVSKDEFIVMLMLAFEGGIMNGITLPIASRDHYKSLYEREGIKTISKKATDAKYSPGRDLYKEAIIIARSKWEKGSPLKHHQMKQYLIREYQVAGKHPFAKFDADCGYTEKGLLERLKGLAKEMKRSDLISGQKKSS